MELAARYNDGRTARTREVRPIIVGDALVIRDTNGLTLETWPGESLRLVDGRKGAGPFRLGWCGNALARLTFDDRAALDELLRAFPQIARSHLPDRRSLRRVALWGGGAVAGVLLFVFAVIPLLASQIAGAIPPRMEARMGDQVAKQLIRILALRAGRPATSMECSDPAGKLALAQLVGRLGDPRQANRVRVVNSSMVNAFALPGGVILIPRGMIAFARSPEAFAGVLAHEMGHVARRHPTETMLKTAGMSLLFSLIVGDVAGASVIVAVGEQAIRGSYGRAAEREADAFATSRLSAAGIDTRPLTAMFEGLLKKEGDGSGALRFMASHPPTGERAAAIRASAGPQGPAMRESQWRKLKAICGRPPADQD